LSSCCSRGGTYEETNSERISSSENSCEMMYFSPLRRMNSSKYSVAITTERGIMMRTPSCMSYWRCLMSMEFMKASPRALPPSEPSPMRAKATASLYVAESKRATTPWPSRRR